MQIELTYEQANIIYQILANTTLKVIDAPQVLQIMDLINAKMAEENKDNIYPLEKKNK